MSIKQNGGVFGRNPTFHDATIENDLSVSGAFSADTASFTGNVDLGDNDRLRLGAGSDLQIYHDGTRNYIDASSETRLRSSSFTLRDSANYIFFATASNNAGNYSLTMYANDTPSMKFQGGSIVAYENIVFNSAGDGIDFSATSGTGTSELFDDYEEGTWTATVGCTGNATTTTTVTAYYTKIGRQVTVSFRDLNDIDTTGLSGFLTVTLPFTCISASVGFIGALIWDSLTYPAGYDLVFPYVANGGSAMAFAIGGSGIADSLLDVSAVTSGTTDLKYATMTYFTA